MWYTTYNMGRYIPLKRPLSMCLNSAWQWGFERTNKGNLMVMLFIYLGCVPWASLSSWILIYQKWFIASLLLSKLRFFLRQSRWFSITICTFDNVSGLWPLLRFYFFDMTLLALDESSTCGITWKNREIDRGRCHAICFQLSEKQMSISWKNIYWSLTYRIVYILSD